VPVTRACRGAQGMVREPLGGSMENMASGMGGEDDWSAAVAVAAPMPSRSPFRAAVAVTRRDTPPLPLPKPAPR
jgi:hypothetical protein